MEQRAYNCVCIKCANIFTVYLGSEEEIKNMACPSCGAAHLRLLPSGIFGT
ncbi:MAG: hypothetical protein M0Z59_07580 [Nitrospiraceae bacterium]|nr:hypothetical protein [Nitrospiraceae bacterium]